MPADVIMPALGMAQDTGKVLRWLRQDGDMVARGEPLLEVETDKVTVEIESPADGTLSGLRAPEGAEVPVGTVIAAVLAPGEEHADVTVVAPPLAVTAVATPVGDATPRHAERRPLASPKARKLAASRGIDLGALTGTGPSGAVTAADVEAVAARGGGDGFEVGTDWRVMAERTTRAWQEVQQFVLTRDVDASRLESWRAVARQKPGCEALGHTDLLVKVSAEALRRHPRLNASWHEGAIVPGTGVNVGIAIATDSGLV